MDVYACDRQEITGREIGSVAFDGMGCLRDNSERTYINSSLGIDYLDCQIVLHYRRVFLFQARVEVKTPVLNSIK